MRSGHGSTFLSSVSAGFLLPAALAAGQTNLQQTNALLWVMIGMSTSGSIITFAFLVYSIWKFRDPKVKNRPYG